jgi:hypothetical protein
MIAFAATVVISYALGAWSWPKIPALWAKFRANPVATVKAAQTDFVADIAAVKARLAALEGKPPVPPAPPAPPAAA